MKMWLESCKARCKKLATKRLVAAVLAAGLVGTVATFTFTRSAKAAAAPAPAAAALDDNSVGALLTLDRAMETLAARVTPAVVNVTVVSKATPEQRRRRACRTCSNFSGRTALSAVSLDVNSAVNSTSSAAPEPDRTRPGQRRDHLA